ncbi:21015_t:CDS:2, partial [Cetraspora pellucida]
VSYITKKVIGIAICVKVYIPILEELINKNEKDKEAQKSKGTQKDKQESTDNDLGILVYKMIKD